MKQVGFCRRSHFDWSWDALSFPSVTTSSFFSLLLVRIKKNITKVFEQNFFHIQLCSTIILPIELKVQISSFSVGHKWFSCQLKRHQDALKDNQFWRLEDWLLHDWKPVLPQSFYGLVKRSWLPWGLSEETRERVQALSVLNIRLYARQSLQKNIEADNQANPLLSNPSSTL